MESDRNFVYYSSQIPHLFAMEENSFAMNYLGQGGVNGIQKAANHGRTKSVIRKGCISLP
jgi:hypothetical protein